MQQLNVPFSEVVNEYVRSLDSAFCHRSSDPLSEGSRRLYSHYANRAARSLGSVPLVELNALKIRSYVDELKRQNLSDASIAGHYQTLKSIIEFNRDEQGNPLMPARFNLSFVGVPVVKPEKQKAPIATTQDIEKGIAVGGEFGVLIALLAGTGLRIGEAISLTVGFGVNFYNPTAGLIHIEAGKTEAATRDIPLPSALNTVIAQYAKNRAGSLFAGHRRVLYHKLREHDLPAFHAYRRFRTTHLRRSRISDEITKYLLGHARRDITDRYSRLTEDREFIRTEVERAGLGFQIQK